MRKLVILIIITLSSCCNSIDCVEPNKEDHFINTKVVIVSSNESDGFNTDKMPQPILVKKWLIKSLEDTLLYRELSSNSYYPCYKITAESWYSHKVKDTLFFKFLAKKYFFKLNKQL